MQCVLDRVARSQAAGSSCSSCNAVAVPAVSARVQRSPMHGLGTAVATHTRREAACVRAYAPSLPSPSLPSHSSALTSTPSGAFGARPSLDPMAATWEQAWEPGRLVTVKGPEQFSDLLLQHPEKLIVLMCKAHSCRPCKMFTRKYLSIAQRFPECILAEIYGDDTGDTRKMMMQMDVRVTPTFRMYRQGDCVNVVTGTNDKKLMRGMLSAMNASELAAHQQEIADTMSFDEADQQLAVANSSGSS